MNGSEKRIYLDNAATTPISREVGEAMAAWLSQEFGNPSSLYAEGREARAAIDETREATSGALGCDFGEVVFTSSGTEAANLALIGAALGNTDISRARILMCAAEHHCVLNCLPMLQRLGYKVELIPVDRAARVDLNALESLLDEDVLLVSVMHANNEIGTIEPAREVADLAHRRGALYFCDAVQTFTVWPWTVDQLGADLLSISAHKVYGPKGVGALYVRAGTKLKPILYGGGQEREMRAGTENVAGVVGFATACRCGASGLEVNSQHIRKCRDGFVSDLDKANMDGLHWSNPNWDEVLPGHAHCRIEGVSAESMLILLDRMGVSASSGAACSSGSLEPSHVLLACGYTQGQAKEGLRFTFGRSNTVEEATRAAQLVAKASTCIRC